MSSSVLNIKESNYFHREYGNDIKRPTSNKTWVDQTKRIAFAALPFAQVALNSYKPANFALALGFGGLRVHTTASQLIEAVKRGSTEEKAYQLLQTTIAVAALTGTIFAHPVGMLISTGHDLIADVVKLMEHLQQGDKEKAIESCLSIINNALYFTLFLHGGLEMTIASLAMQILLGIYRSQKELRNDHWIEALGHLGMSFVRGNQALSQFQMLQANNVFKALSTKAKITQPSLKASIADIKEEHSKQLITFSKVTNSDNFALNPVNSGSLDREQEHLILSPSQQKEIQGVTVCNAEPIYYAPQGRVYVDVLNSFEDRLLVQVKAESAPRAIYEGYFFRERNYIVYTRSDSLAEVTFLGIWEEGPDGRGVIAWIPS